MHTRSIAKAQNGGRRRSLSSTILKLKFHRRSSTAIDAAEHAERLSGATGGVPQRGAAQWRFSRTHRPESAPAGRAGERTVPAELSVVRVRVRPWLAGLTHRRRRWIGVAPPGSTTWRSRQPPVLPVVLLVLLPVLPVLLLVRHVAVAAAAAAAVSRLFGAPADAPADPAAAAGAVAATAETTRLRCPPRCARPDGLLRIADTRREGAAGAPGVAVSTAWPADRPCAALASGDARLGGADHGPSTRHHHAMGCRGMVLADQVSLHSAGSRAPATAWLQTI